MKTKNLFIVVLIMICTDFLMGCKKKETPIPEPQPSYTIGQNFGGGVIFYLDGTGQHGLISSTSNQSDSTTWNNGSNIVTNATGTALGTGKTNTATIVGYQGPGDYAAYICDQLVLGGFSDWFLPSKDEINLMYQRRDIIGGFSTGRYYWSSSEYDYNHALIQGFSNGSNGPGIKGGPCRIRAIRAF